MWQLSRHGNGRERRQPTWNSSLDDLEDAIWKMSSQELRRPEHQFNNGKDVSLVISTKLGYIFLGKLSHISLPDSYRATISIGPIFFFRSVLGDFWCRRIPQNPLVVWSPDPSNGSGCINWSIKITGNKWTLKWVWVNTYRYILVGWTSIYQLFWCSPGLHGFDPSPN